MDLSRRLLGALLTASLATAALVAGCSQSYEWKTSNITGKFPDLEFQLTDESGSVLAFDRRDKARLQFTAGGAGGGPSDSIDAIASDLKAFPASATRISAPTSLTKAVASDCD